MRVSEIIRQVLDIIDQAEVQRADTPAKNLGYIDKDIKRFRQIAGLTTDKQYDTKPNEQYMNINAVTIDAGADQWQGTKDPADIRGEQPSIYPGKVYGAE